MHHVTQFGDILPGLWQGVSDHVEMRLRGRVQQMQGVRHHGVGRRQSPCRFGQSVDGDGAVLHADVADRIQRVLQGRQRL